MDFASELNKRVDNRRRPRSNQLADRILASAYGRQRGGFLITLNTIGQLMPYEDLLSTKQKRDLLSAIKTDSDFHINQLKHRCVVALELFLHPLVFHQLLTLFKKNDRRKCTKIWEKSSARKTRWPWSPSIGYV